MIASDRGLVLRTFELRETSKIVSVLAAQHGRLRLVARGVRSPRHRFAASVEPGNEIELVFSLKPGSELGTLREASLRQAWVASGRRLEAMAAGLAVLELLERLVPEGAVEPGLLEEALAALAALRASAERGPTLLAFYAFELRVLGRLGLQPELGACSRCGVPPTNGAVLDVMAGALLCRRCGGPGARRLLLSQEGATALAWLAARGWPEILALPTDSRTRRLLGLAVHRLLGAHLERYRYPRALQLLKRVDRGTAVDGAPPARPGGSTEPQSPCSP